MININQTFFLSLLIVLSFISCYSSILQTFEYRKSFAELERLQLEKENLSFQSNILLEEVKYYKNHFFFFVSYKIIII